MIKSAIFSECGRYRYELQRIWGPSHLVLWIMLNPSTADDVEDDATIRKCIGFANRWGYDGIIVCNIFPYRATNPKALKEVDPDQLYGRGHLNGIAIRDALQRASRVVCAWGNIPVKTERNQGKYMVRSIRNQNRLPACLGTTRRGEPRHPLYVSYGTKLVAVEMQ